MKIDVYIHIAVMGNVNDVLQNLLLRIDNSGLYNNSNKIYLSINGDITGLTIDLKKEKYVIINNNKDIRMCEFPTINLIHENCKNDEDETYVLYLMTKGVSKNNPNITDQLNLLSYFNINKWDNRIKELEENDCTGVNFRGNLDDIKYHPSTWGYGKAPLHYSGNFWWTKSSHVKKLVNPIKWAPDNDLFRWRMMCEMWVCQIDGNYHNAYSSNVDHYMSMYPSNLYEDKV